MLQLLRQKCEQILLRLTAITFSLVILACALFAAAGDTLPARAQVAVAHRPAAPAIVPGFWDPRRRPERPDLARLTAIRFMTEVDYPPFNFAVPDGNPAGFNVDLARMVCEELKVTRDEFLALFDAIDSDKLGFLSQDDVRQTFGTPNRAARVPTGSDRPTRPMLLKSFVRGSSGRSRRGRPRATRPPTSRSGRSTAGRRSRSRRSSARSRSS